MFDVVWDGDACGHLPKESPSVNFSSGRKSFPVKFKSKFVRGFLKSVPVTSRAARFCKVSSLRLSWTVRCPSNTTSQ